MSSCSPVDAPPEVAAPCFASPLDSPHANDAFADDQGLVDATDAPMHSEETAQTMGQFTESMTVAVQAADEAWEAQYALLPCQSLVQQAYIEWTRILDEKEGHLFAIRAEKLRIEDELAEYKKEAAEFLKALCESPAIA